MRTIILALALMLTGCSTVKEWIPSFWDDAQSRKIVDIRLAAEQLDCTKTQLPQLLPIQADLRWFELYSKGKGWRQNDVLRLVEPLQETVNDWVKRSQEKEGSLAYCKIKRQLVITQSSRAAEAVLGRF